MTKKKPTHYVFSTLTAPQIYTRTAMTDGNDLPQTVGEVFIAGGSNVPDKYMRTPLGVATPVNDDEMAILNDNDVFKLHQKNGFITVRTADADPETVAADMETRDQSAPLVEQDFADLPEEQQPKLNTPTTAKNNRKA